MPAATRPFAWRSRPPCATAWKTASPCGSTRPKNPAVPPFGFVLDYLAYGGLYREVWLDVRGADMIEDVFVTTPTLTRAEIALTVSGSGAAGARHAARRRGRGLRHGGG